jgi:hypothetical protein
MRDGSAARLARHVLGGAVLVGLGYFLWSEVRKHWAAVATFRLVLSPGELCVAGALGLASFLLETRAWQRAVNGTLEREAMTFGDSLAVLNTSGLLKYLPGRVWTYGAQMIWLAKHGISKGKVVYINLLCLLCSLLVSTSLGGAYFIVYLAPAAWAAVAWCGLLVAHAAALFLGPRVIGLSLGLVQRFAHRQVEVIPTPPRLLLEIDAIYVASWAAIGIAGYYSALGVGLVVTPHDVMAIMGSMSIAWTIGYLSALTPGGLGVREGLMYVMLHRVSTPQAALVLPVVSRLLYLAIEVGLGAAGFFIGVRRGLFAGSTPARS